MLQPNLPVSNTENGDWASGCFVLSPESGDKITAPDKARWVWIGCLSPTGAKYGIYGTLTKRKYSSRRLQNTAERSETHSLKTSYAEMGPLRQYLAPYRVPPVTWKLCNSLLKLCNAFEHGGNYFCYLHIWTEIPKGLHFAAMEHPEFMAGS
jgi:hypothetical protein